MKILDRLPIPEHESIVYVGEERIRVRASQLIVWMSITLRNVDGLADHVPRFPVILDTGHSHYFAIQEQHLTRWAGFRRGQLSIQRYIRHLGQRLPLLGAKLWLHSNRTGTTECSEKYRQMESMPGIALFPNSGNFPRLPLLGLRAVTVNHFYLSLDGEQLSLTMRSPDWRSRILRLLR